MADEFSIPLDIIELIVPEGLFSVRFESHSHASGVSPPFNSTDHVREPTTRLGGLPHVRERAALVYAGGTFE